MQTVKPGLYRLHQISCKYITIRIIVVAKKVCSLFKKLCYFAKRFNGLVYVTQ